ncbi:ATP-dependent DNA helicase RecQ [Polaribacter sp. IC073]|uniref:RecQ family ATP-dependent DNA helicase n=1 Tax=Polaribacter sp. IC073 TaxID=2508540 RepID=UPI0011BF9874|nr:ATP-dependent DNA helicase RecQ [Polaribacter sp. IC073]TXD47314.1 RecQ family ATP-dependent DNA helicase [Polaribacter sp. IC073]
MTTSPEKILEQYWGFTSFRTPQKEIITCVLENRDAIALLPTGGGKSICFQVPALVKEGVCIVISPLIALMQDQVENLKRRDIKAVTIPSGSSQDEIVTLFDKIKFGRVKFLYLSPERLQSSLIQQKLKELNVNLVAIDEAHCISEWGHDFRPSYRNINVLKEILPEVNFIALTATANKKVLADISNNLQLTNHITFKKSFYRENLAYQIFKIEDKLDRLLQIFTKTKVPAIIYVNSRKKTEEIANFLKANQFKSTFYHAGLTVVEKQTAFKDWMTEKKPIIVATNAFGMGIDKPNVGLVIHYNLPTSIENYVQETGRAGRNEKKSFGVLLYNEHDIFLHKKQTENSIPSILEVKEVHKKLYQHFRIANGELLEETFSFNFFEFCKKYNFPVLKTDVILKLLVNYGILELNNSFNKKSTLKVIGTHYTVLNFSRSNTAFKNFINVLLRTYGGLFEDEIKINEFFLAKKASITSTQVIKNLEILEAQNLVEYNQANGNISLNFLLPREDDKTINRFSKEIKQFLFLKKEKAINFINFVTDNTVCRSVQLLAYFDEKATSPCGICDVCIGNKKRDTKNLSSEILALLKEKEQLSSKEISRLLNTFEKDILIHLQTLLSEDKITINNQNKFQLKI